MRVLATFLLMVSLFAMSVTAASADIARPPCSSQIRADDMCYAAGLPGSTAGTAKKPGVCFVCIAPADSIGVPVPPAVRVSTAPAAGIRTEDRWTAPWRPPRP